MDRSQGDKRRKIGEGPALEGEDRADEPDQIADIVRPYGRCEVNASSKLFDNVDFGYTRVTVERPLKLRYQMTLEDKARFLDAASHLLIDVQAIDKALGREPHLDWNVVWASIEMLLRAVTLTTLGNERCSALALLSNSSVPNYANRSAPACVTIGKRRTDAW